MRPVYGAIPAGENGRADSGLHPLPRVPRAFQRLLPQTRMIHVGEALAEFLREEFGGCTGGEGRTEYYVTERSAAFDETVRIMDQTVDPSSIRVETDFLG